MEVEEEEKEDPRALQRPNDSLISQSEAKMVSREGGDGGGGEEAIFHSRA